LRAPDQQKILVQQGFRPVVDLDLTTVAGSPFSQGIPGVAVSPPVELLPTPPSAVLQEIQKQWQRATVG
jgi:hypothetical protein